eukprot:14214603-Heterocapsa_arctica.AAC.1
MVEGRGRPQGLTPLTGSLTRDRSSWARPRRQLAEFLCLVMRRDLKASRHTTPLRTAARSSAPRL